MSLGLLIWIGVAVLGLVALVRTIRGRRVGDAPHCKHCGYNLTGLDLVRCPECGSDLQTAQDGTSAVIIGDRQRSPNRITLAATLLLLGATGIVLNVGPLKIKWLKYAPTVWVTSLAESGQKASLDELIRRYDDKLLSSAQIGAAIDAGLRVQGEPTKPPLLEEWLEFLGNSLATREMSSAQVSMFLKNSVTLTMETRPVIRRGDVLPIKLIENGRVSANTIVWMYLSEHCARINDTIVQQPKGIFGEGISGIGPDSASWWPANTPVDLPPGDYELVYTLPCRFFVNEPFDSEKATPDFKTTKVLRAPVKVVGHDTQDPIQISRDPKLGNLIRRCTDIVDVEVNLKNKLGQIKLRVDYAAHLLKPGATLPTPLVVPPIDLAFRVIINTGRFEQEICWITCPKGKARVLERSARLDEEHEFIDDLLNAETVTVILRGDIDVARRTVDLTHIWIGEIQFDDVPVKIVR